MTGVPIEPGGDPAAGPDDVPAEVSDHVDPADAPIEPTPLDEDTSEPITAEDVVEFRDTYGADPDADQ